MNLPRTRIEKYLSMKRHEHRAYAAKMAQRHGDKWLDAVAAVRDDAIGSVVRTNHRTNVIEVELFNRTGRIKFNSLEFYGIPAADLWIGELIATVPT